jgi:hypothetical protein
LKFGAVQHPKTSDVHHDFFSNPVCDALFKNRSKKTVVTASKNVAAKTKTTTEAAVDICSPHGIIGLKFGGVLNSEASHVHHDSFSNPVSDDLKTKNRKRMATASENVAAERKRAKDATINDYSPHDHLRSKFRSVEEAEAARLQCANIGVCNAGILCDIPNQNSCVHRVNDIEEEEIGVSSEMGKIQMGTMTTGIFCANKKHTTEM